MGYPANPAGNGDATAAVGATPDYNGRQTHQVHIMVDGGSTVGYPEETTGSQGAPEAVYDMLSNYVPGHSGDRAEYSGTTGHELFVEAGPTDKAHCGADKTGVRTKGYNLMGGTKYFVGAMYGPDYGGTGCGGTNARPRRSSEGEGADCREGGIRYRPGIGGIDYRASIGHDRSSSRSSNGNREGSSWGSDVNRKGKADCEADQGPGSNQTDCKGSGGETDRNWGAESEAGCRETAMSKADESENRVRAKVKKGSGLRLQLGNEHDSTTTEQEEGRVKHVAVVLLRNNKQMQVTYSARGMYAMGYVCNAAGSQSIIMSQ